MTSLRRFLKTFHIFNPHLDFRRSVIKPHLVLEDGTRLSVQASETHYCKPRNEAGRYYKVEVASTEKHELLEEHMDGPPPQMSGEMCYLYAYVPTEKVEEVIRRRGGVKKVSLPVRIGYPKKALPARS